jgi:lipoprotein-releasing system permease protein
MNLSLSIAAAYMRHRKRASLISILGVTIGVGAYIAIAAMMQGFQNYFVSQIIDVAPHVVMRDEFRNPPPQPAALVYGPEAAIALRGQKPKEELRGIRNHRAVLEAASALPGAAVAPALTAQALIRYGGRDLGVTLTGIRPEDEPRVSNLEKDLIAGRLDNLATTANGVIIGSGIAYRLGLQMGDRVTVVGPTGNRLTMKIAGIFNTGITNIDDGTAYALLKKVQVLQDRINVVNQIRLRLADVDTARDVAASLEGRFGYRTEGWQETNSNVFSIFRIQNIIMYSTVGMIALVAAFGIYNIISTVVTEKHRDIAILKSMGFAERAIEQVFLMQGLLVGVIGAVCGWLLGYALVEALAAIRLPMEGFARHDGLILYRSTAHYVQSGIVGTLAAVLAAVLPARKAARVQPVDIVRSAA